MQLIDIIQKHNRLPENLIHMLLEYQSSKDRNYISEDEVKLMAKEVDVSESRIYSLLTFYSLFSTVPRGKYVIQVCRDVPCHVNGSMNVVRELEESLDIKMGETTGDGVFTIEYSSCLGCCDKSPAMRIGEEIFGNLTKGKIGEILSSYRRKYNENKE